MTAPSLKERAILMSRGGLSNDVISGVLGISLADVEALMVQANPDVELPGGTTDLPLFQTSVDLDYDQMVALPNTPVEILPEPPEGSMWLPFWAFLQMNEQGDFGGWSNTDDNAEISLHDGASSTRRVTRSFLASLDDFFVDGGGFLLVPEATTRLPGGSYPAGEPIVHTQQPVDAASLDGSVVLRVVSQPANFTPNDEGGYPDSHMRVTVAYAEIVKFTD